ncbi:RNA helicase [Malassezia sp. CBS 17886]|nr:RNA helicase [Malassezia sp. CBS 17886]
MSGVEEDKAVTSLSSRLGGILSDALKEGEDEGAEWAEDRAAEKGGEAEPSLTEPSYDVQVTLADQQADPNSPLYSAKSFDQLGLHEDLIKGIYAMKFTKPSKIQERALPLLLQNPARNMIGQSQSGTGKTAAFVLTMLSRIDFSVAKTQAVALAPSRELARQIMDVVQAMGRFTAVTTAYAIPDAVKRGEKVTAQLVVGTPGKMFDLIKTRALDPSAVKVFVLDEADNMLDQQGLGEQSIRVKNTMPRSCQLVLFSATFPEHVRVFAEKFATGANEIRLRQEELSVESIKQFYMDCRSEEHRYEVLVELYNLLTIGQSIIFCAKRDTADRIAQRMTAEGHRVDSLHGKLDNADRDRTIDNFRSGRSKVLIATNVIARGIDIQQVTLVINYDMPLTQSGEPDSETYLHRIGRTGRFGRRGVSINFVYNPASRAQMEAIEKALHCKMVSVATDDVEEMEATIKDDVSHCDMSQLSLADVSGADSSRTRAATLPADVRAQLQRWVLSVACVNFDLELGPDVEFMYPALGISKEEKDNIAFSSFPDTAVFEDGSLVFSWRVREVPLSASAAHPPKVRDVSAPPSPSPPLPSPSSPPTLSPPSSPQPRTPTRRFSRGGSPGVRRRPSLSQSARNMAKSILQPRSADMAHAQAPPPPVSRSTSYLYGFVYFRQKKDARVRRGYFQKSLVLLTHLPYVALFGAVMDTLGPQYFEHGLSALESFVREVARWPAPRLGSALELPLFGSPLNVSLPLGNEAQSGPWAWSSSGPGTSMDASTILASVPRNSLLLIFRTMLADLWRLWECMLLAEPILVVGCDPRTTSDAVWHLVGLIRPLQCAGDFRPYFHIHDYDFQALITRNKPQAGSVLGVTNPFFLQTCAHWPHVVRVAPQALDGTDVPGQTSARVAPTGLESLHKRRISKDRALLRQLVEMANDPSQHARADALLRRHFADRTERFLAPLNRYMASLIPASFDLSSPTETPPLRPFRREAFFAFLRTHGSSLPMRQRSLSTAAAQRNALYADFLQCPNFSLWLQSRVQAADEEHTQRRIAALAAGDVVAFSRARSEIECVDLCLRLVDELHAMDEQLACSDAPAPSTRWRARGMPEAPEADRGALRTGRVDDAAPASRISTRASSMPGRALQAQRARLEAQLNRLLATLPDDLRPGLLAKVRGAQGADGAGAMRETAASGMMDPPHVHDTAPRPATPHSITTPPLPPGAPAAAARMDLP